MLLSLLVIPIIAVTDFLGNRTISLETLRPIFLSQSNIDTISFCISKAKSPYPGLYLKVNFSSPLSIPLLILSCKLSHTSSIAVVAQESNIKAL